MKKYIFICLLSLTGPGCFSQIQRKIVRQKSDSATTEIAPVKENESGRGIFRELDLTKEQKGKLREFNQSAKSAREAIENNTALSESQKKEKIRTLRKEMAVKTESILTAEQKIKFRELKSKKGRNSQL
jgi:Spy/CpxP family protein refolding chaperone